MKYIKSFLLTILLGPIILVWYMLDYIHGYDEANELLKQIWK